jgi:hypothetical protein
MVQILKISGKGHVKSYLLAINHVYVHVTYICTYTLRPN